MGSLLKDRPLDEAAEEVDPAQRVQPKQPMPLVDNDTISIEFFEVIIILAQGLRWTPKLPPYSGSCLSR